MGEPRLRIPARELTIRFVRSSGAGGQNVNKVNTKAVLRWPIAASRALPDDVRRRFLERWASRITVDGEVVLTSDRHRDQGRNVADCLDKLGAMVDAVATPPRPRKKTRPSRTAVERRLQEKRAQAQKKRRRAALAD
ncbi:MAG: alternative ribosome rescue aminoacyl-tRNA hydrolase ArfB [Thermodesulfobacteriota bacterium]